MLSYLEAGSGTPVALVHGNFACKEWWRSLLEDPPPGARLLAPDLPGFGESPAPEGFVPSIPAYAQALRDFLRAVGAEEVTSLLLASCAVPCMLEGMLMT